MAIYVCRDFLTLTNAVSPAFPVYLLTLFMSGVLGFERKGHTNMGFNPSASGSVAANTGASINLGAGKQYYVSVPTGSYTVTASGDNGKILVLKSVDYPRHNSGLFRVLSGSVVDNAFIVDYRTPGGIYPPIESGSLSGSIDWRLHPSENSGFFTSETFASETPANNQTYRTKGNSTYPRIILQSPHTSSWQVRLCLESYDDRWNGTSNNGWHQGNSFSVGTGGLSTGDWPVGGDHSHGALWWNRSTADSVGGQQCGLGPGVYSFGSWGNYQGRVYIWGNSDTGSVVITIRYVGVSGFTDQGTAMFGLPENEPVPLPTLTKHRLFTVGYSDYRAFNFNWNVGTLNEYGYTGQACGFSGQPISCVPQAYHIIYADQYPETFVTQDNPVLKATELVPVELIAGTFTTGYVRSSPLNGTIMFLEPRRLGQCPMIRLGRNNFASFSTTSDSGLSWFHTANGAYLPWSGPAVLP